MPTTTSPAAMTIAGSTVAWFGGAAVVAAAAWDAMRRPTEAPADAATDGMQWPADGKVPGGHVPLAAIGALTTEHRPPTMTPGTPTPWPEQACVPQHGL